MITFACFISTPLKLLFAIYKFGWRLKLAEEENTREVCRNCWVRRESRAAELLMFRQGLFPTIPCISSIHGGQTPLPQDLLVGATFRSRSGICQALDRDRLRRLLPRDLPDLTIAARGRSHRTPTGLVLLIIMSGLEFGSLSRVHVYLVSQCQIMTSGDSDRSFAIFIKKTRADTLPGLVAGNSNTHFLSLPLPSLSALCGT